MDMAQRRRHTAKQRRAARVTAYRRVAWKRFRAGDHKGFEHYMRVADRAQRQADRENERDERRRDA